MLQNPKNENDENVPCSSSRKKTQQKKGGAKNHNHLMIRMMKMYGGVENAATNGITIVQIVGLFVTFEVNVFTSNVLV